MDLDLYCAAASALRASAVEVLLLTGGSSVASVVGLGRIGRAVSTDDWVDIIGKVCCDGTRVYVSEAAQLSACPPRIFPMWRDGSAVSQCLRLMADGATLSCTLSSQGLTHQKYHKPLVYAANVPRRSDARD
jgi:hypothetical protein